MQLVVEVVIVLVAFASIDGWCELLSVWLEMVVEMVVKLGIRVASTMVFARVVVKVVTTVVIMEGEVLMEW